MLLQGEKKSHVLDGMRKKNCTETRNFFSFSSFFFLNNKVVTYKYSLYRKSICRTFFFFFYKLKPEYRKKYMYKYSKRHCDTKFLSEWKKH